MTKRIVSVLLTVLIICLMLCGCGAASGPAEGSGATVYITESGKKYHVKECGHAKNAKPVDILKAVEAGYEPCSACHPPIVTSSGKIQQQKTDQVENRSDYVPASFDPKDIPLHEVESSSLSRLGYDSKEKVLVVEFTSGGIYAYYDVPQSVYSSLKNAESLGNYFYYSIRDNYKYEKLS